MFGVTLEIKTPEQILLMREAGLVVADALAAVRDAVRPGVTTGELDQVAAGLIRSRGAAPSFLGYGEPPFPATICASVNDAVVHGIPGGQVLAEGDIVSIDCGAIVADDSGQGWHGDAATTVAVGAVPDQVTELMRVTEESLWRGLAAARPGGRVGDISHAIESYVRSEGDYGIVEDYTGHGIGTEMHLPPDVPNYGRAGRGPRLKRGLALAVAAHFEHTFALTETGVWVLTAHDGGRAALERLGAPYGGN